MLPKIGCELHAAMRCNLERRAWGYLQLLFFISYDIVKFANACPHRRAKPFDADGLWGIVPGMQKHSKEALIEQLHTFSQTLRPFAALWNKWNTAQQMVCKTTKRGINKPRRRALPHREISTIISCGFKMNSLRFGAVYSR